MTLSPQEFAALGRWIKAEAKLAVAERTYQNDRAIAEVAAKAQKAASAAHDLLVGD